ncbi:MGMT family protein [Methanosphaera sp. WGK6]|uniref:MGMT family protein n=1 Tax=Methanosphaera sp. WGK6 TaxID=1561964 RepID=UPI000A02DFB0|nr:MGMT family protein [Methanosphaera sp. WGK6]
MLSLGSLKYVVFNSLIGEIGLVWDKNEIIKQIVLPHVQTKKFSYSSLQYKGVLQCTNPSEYIHNVMSDIKNIIMGNNNIHFEDNQLDLDVLTDFQKVVLLKQNAIPYGKVITYKKLADMIGKPRSARPVANVLSSNPFPLIIPCHRTVRSDWTIGGYAGTKDGYFKQFILENEGIQFENGVVKKEYRYQCEDLEVKNVVL